MEKQAAAAILLDWRKCNFVEDDVRASSDACIFFVERFCYTYDPRTKEKDLRFILYPYQKELIFDMVQAIMMGDMDLFIEKSRDMGATWVILAVLVWFFCKVSKFQALLGSRKQEYVDDWTLQTLFPRMEYLLAKLPAGLVKFSRSFMKLVNESNGSTLIGESANAHFSRSGRFNVILFDELAFWPWQQSSWEAAGEATPCRIAITTPSEEPTYAKALRTLGLAKLITLHWTLHPKKDAAWYERAKKRKTKEEVARELDINWEGSLTSLVYPEISNTIIGDFPYNPVLPLYETWDFGLDGTALQYWQVNPSTGKRRLVESYTNLDKPIQFFFPFVGQPINSQFVYTDEDIEVINKVKDWKKAVHFGDPDVAKRAYQSAELTSTRLELQKVGVYVQTKPEASDLETRKTKTKLMLQDGIELNDTPGCRLWLEAMKQARYPKRSEGSQSVSENIKPIHDWSSHPRTSTEYFAVNYEPIQEDVPQATTMEGSAGNYRLADRKSPAVARKLA